MDMAPAEQMRPNEEASDSTVLRCRQQRELEAPTLLARADGVIE
jgi:hypothetical protein